MLEASDEVIVLSITILGDAQGDAQGSYDGRGKVSLVLRRKGLEDNARNGDGCSEDDGVRSEGHDGYWSRHNGDLWSGFLGFWVIRMSW